MISISMQPSLISFSSHDRLIRKVGQNSDSSLVSIQLQHSPNLTFASRVKPTLSSTDAKDDEDLLFNDDRCSSRIPRSFSGQVAKLSCSSSSNDPVSIANSTLTTPAQPMTTRHSSLQYPTSAFRCPLDSLAPCGTGSTTFYFHPNHRPIKVWHVILALAIIYNMFAIPYRTVFAELSTFNLPIWFSLDYSFDMVYLLDMIVASRTAYLDQNDRLQSQAIEMRRQYTSSYGFYADCLALLPFDLLYISIGFNSWLRLMRLCKLFKLCSMINQRIEFPQLGAIKLILAYAIVLHWNACFMKLFEKSLIFDISSNRSCHRQLPIANQPLPVNVSSITNTDDATIPVSNYINSFDDYSLHLYLGVTGLLSFGARPIPHSTSAYWFMLIEGLTGLALMAFTIGFVSCKLTNEVKINTNVKIENNDKHNSTDDDKQISTTHHNQNNDLSEFNPFHHQHRHDHQQRTDLNDSRMMSTRAHPLDNTDNGSKAISGLDYHNIPRQCLQKSAGCRCDERATASSFDQSLCNFNCRQSLSLKRQRRLNQYHRCVQLEGATRTASRLHPAYQHGTVHCISSRYTSKSSCLESSSINVVEDDDRHWSSNLRHRGDHSLMMNKSPSTSQYVTDVPRICFHSASSSSSSASTIDSNQLTSSFDESLECNRDNNRTTTHSSSTASTRLTTLSPTQCSSNSSLSLDCKPHQSGLLEVPVLHHPTPNRPPTRQLALSRASIVTTSVSTNSSSSSGQSRSSQQITDPTTSSLLLIEQIHSLNRAVASLRNELQRVVVNESRDKYCLHCQQSRCFDKR